MESAPQRSLILWHWAEYHVHLDDFFFCLFLSAVWGPSSAERRNCLQVRWLRESKILDVSGTSS
jgi:hypothetical protein